MNKSIIIGIVAVVVALGIGFFAGMQYTVGKSPIRSANGNFYSRNGMGGRFGQGFGGQANATFRPVRGQVLSVNGTTMTVKLNNGTSRIVVLSDKTVYQKSSSTSASDVKAGDTVMVIGKQNSDGSVTADNVDLNPPKLRGSAPSGGAQ